MSYWSSVTSALSGTANAIGSTAGTAGNYLYEGGEFLVEDLAGPVARTAESGVENIDEGASYLGGLFQGDGFSLDSIISQDTQNAISEAGGEELYDAGEFLVEDVFGTGTQLAERGIEGLGQGGSNFISSAEQTIEGLDIPEFDGAEGTTRQGGGKAGRRESEQNQETEQPSINFPDPSIFTPSGGSGNETPDIDVQVPGQGGQNRIIPFPTGGQTPQTQRRRQSQQASIFGGSPMTILLIGATAFGIYQVIQS